MPDARVASAFADLYAACGLPAPSVRIERTRDGYLRSVAALSAEGLGSAARSAYELLGLFAWFSFMTGLAGLMTCVWRWFAEVGDPSRIGGERFAALVFVGMTAGGVLMGYIAFRRFSGGPRGRRASRHLELVGLVRAAPTSPRMEALLGAALRAVAPNNPAPVPPPSRSVLDGCFRLGRNRVAPAAPDARRNALVGRPFGTEAPAVLRLASAASSLVEEAVLLEGSVLAFAPEAGSVEGMTVHPTDGTAVAELSPPAADGATVAAISPPAADGAAPTTLARVASLALLSPPEEAEAILRLVGLDAAAASLGVVPVREDSSGRLYRFRDDLCMVRVQDEVAGPDGKPLVHWISVPPWILSPQEGVAWSFGLPEVDYAPTAQS